MRKTTRITIIFGALLTGLIAGRLLAVAAPIDAPWLLPLALAAGLIVMVGLSRHRHRATRIGLILLMLALGLWRANQSAADRLQLTSLIDHEITVTGLIADDPAVNPTTGQVDFKLAHLQLETIDQTADQPRAGRTLPGTLSVHEYPIRVQRGYQVRLSGKVKPGYGNNVASLSFPKFELTSSHQDPLEHLRQHFFTGMRTALPEPVASFGLGLLVGIRALIPKDMQATLSLVGLSHLVAVSGYNLTIIIQATDRLLKKASRGINLATSLWLIIGFLIISGASASIVRASLVSVLSLLAGFYGRRFHPLNLILITAGITAFVSPLYLTDLGWLLSFLAFFGILVLAPIVEAKLRHPKPIIARLAIESTTAQLLTMPLILYFFGELSIIAPLTNLIILPMIPLAMAVSFVAGLAGMIMPAFAGWLAWPAQLLLAFIIKLIDAFAALPWAGRDEHLSLIAMIVFYALILAGSLALSRHKGVKSQTDPRAPLAIG